MIDDELARVIESNRQSMSKEHLSEEEVRSLLPKFESLEEDFREIGRTLDAHTATWRKVKGKERLPLLINSRAETVRCLSDADPDIRELALHLAIEHWHITDGIPELCERMAISDPSPSVRAYAIGKLGAVYCGQKNAQMAKMCARIVAATNVSPEERECAYFALLLIMDEEGFSVPHIMMNYPESIDWGFVNRNL